MFGFKKFFYIFINCVLQIIIFLLLLCFISLFWGSKNFGNIGIDEVLFTLNMPVNGVASSFVSSYIIKSFIPTLAIFLLQIFFLYFNPKFILSIRFNLASGKFRSLDFFKFSSRIRFCLLEIVVLIVLVLFSANINLGLMDYIGNHVDESNFIEENYVDPRGVDIVFPSKKKNLIWIYLESGESSNQDRENGGLFDENYIPEMTYLARKYVSFSHSDKIEGATVAPGCGWTIAGLVAQTSGMPLKLYSHNRVVENSMDKFDSFLPGVYSLGDILEDNGYDNYFLAGSDFDFGGRRNYFTEHGDYRIWDYFSAIESGALPKDYKVWWGFEDEKLYMFARKQLLDIAKSDRPFNFSMITVDTHHQDGYVCPLCRNDFSSQYANVWACASRQVYDFVRWIQAQDFYKDTVIVITGDHCSMDSKFYGDYSYDKHRGEKTRKVYNVIINGSKRPVRMSGRRFTTLDMFPTVLSSLGCQIENSRLGLGTDLYSDRETLSEVYGYDFLFDELYKKSKFYDEILLKLDN